MSGTAEAISASTPALPWARAKSSGSTLPPSEGSTATFPVTFEGRSTWAALAGAARPATSPSKRITTSRQSQRSSSSRCSGVSAVPQTATAFFTPAWCRPMTSKYPSTSTAERVLRIDSRARSRP